VINECLHSRYVFIWDVARTRTTFIFDTTILSIVSKMDMIRSATFDEMKFGVASVRDFDDPTKKADCSQAAQASLVICVHV